MKKRPTRHKPDLAHMRPRVNLILRESSLLFTYCTVHRYMVYIYQTGDEPQKQDTQANKRSPLLSEEVPYQITLIRLRQGSLDRRRREKVIWKMFTENDCYPFTDLEGES